MLKSSKASIATISVFFAGLACSHPSYIWYSQVPQHEASAVRSTIEPGDRILVEVSAHPELSGEYEISVSGAYVQPVAGSISIGGTTPDVAATRVQEALASLIAVPSVKVTHRALPPIRVVVVGEVAHTGTFEVPHDSNLLGVIATAGGLSAFADEDSIYLLRFAPQPQRIRFRYSDLTRPDPVAASFQLRRGDTILVE